MCSWFGLPQPNRLELLQLQSAYSMALTSLPPLLQPLLLLSLSPEPHQSTCPGTLTLLGVRELTKPVSYLTFLQLVQACQVFIPVTHLWWR